MQFRCALELDASRSETVAVVTVWMIPVAQRRFLSVFGPNLTTFESQKSKFAQPETLSC